MTTVEENERLCRIEGDTPMAAVFRRYWLPFALAEELPEPDCPPIRVRLLGEDLVAFRDSDGAVGLLDAHCPHRRAPLFFGRNEECGLRCIYHGWKFDVSGACVDMPSEPDYSRFRFSVTVPAYPTFEGAGLLWAYLGAGEATPPKPDYEWLRVPPTHLVVSKSMQQCNYLQAVEGGIDTVHSSFLHNNDIQSPLGLRSRDKHPRIEVEETEFGYRYVSLRDIGDGRYYARVNNFLLPSMNNFGQTIDDSGDPAKLPTITSLFWIPMDNETTAIFNVCWKATQGDPLPDGFGHQHEARFGTAVESRMPGSYWNIRNRDNDYLIDRELQRWKTYSGIEGIAIQDYAVQEGMGLITDRSKEHLASSDQAIIAARRLLLEATDEVEAGRQPRGALPESHRNVRPADVFLEAGQPWREAVDAEIVATW